MTSSSQTDSTRSPQSNQQKPSAYLELALKVVGTVATLGPFLWTIYIYATSYSAQTQTAALEAQIKELEVKKPFLDRQLLLYTEATQVAAYLTTHQAQKRDPTYQKQWARFKELYWGELAMVENGGLKSQSGGVEGAMVRFKTCFEGNGCVVLDKNKAQDLEHVSLDLAHACRDSLAESWNITDWKAPQYKK